MLCLSPRHTKDWHVPKFPIMQLGIALIAVALLSVHVLQSNFARLGVLSNSLTV